MNWQNYESSLPSNVYIYLQFIEKTREKEIEKIEASALWWWTKQLQNQDASELMELSCKRLYGVPRQQKLRTFFATVVSGSAAFVSALLRAIKRLYRAVPESIRCAGYVLQLERVTGASQPCIYSNAKVFKRSFQPFIRSSSFFFLFHGRITILRLMS